MHEQGLRNHLFQTQGQVKATKLEARKTTTIWVYVQIIEKQKLMTMLGGMRPTYDVFSTLTKRTLNETITLDVAKALLFNHEGNLARRKTIKILPLPTTNMIQGT